MHRLHSFKPSKAKAIALAGLAGAVLCATLVLAALFDEGSSLEDVFNHDLHAFLMENQAKGVSDLVSDFEYRQLTYLPLVVPNPEYIHVQSGGVLAFDPAEFPAEFVKGLVAVEEAAITTYPITVYEDSRNRERVILNARNERIGGQYAPRDYDPQWYVKEQYPGLPDMDPDAARHLIATYDPSRVLITYDLLPVGEELIQYVWKQSIDAAIRADKDGAGGGGMRTSWEGGTVSNLQFTAIDWETNGTMTVTLAYPWEYTNDSSTAFEIFTCDGPLGLIHSWWDPGTMTNVDTSTNWVSWNDTGIVRSYGDVRYYVAAVSNDVDGDGATDGFERYVSHTGVTNSNSYPVCVSGTISYNGPVSGPVRMVAVTASNSWIGCMATIPAPGTYTNDRVANGTSYWFRAYRDVDSSKTRDFGEPWGEYSSSSILVTNDRTGISITLTDRDEDDDGLMDWWEMEYFGDSDEVSSGDPDADGLSNDDEETYGTDPTDGDSDEDGMGDGAEVDNDMSPSTSNVYYTLPFVEGFETNTVTEGSISNQNGWVAWPTNKAVVVTDNVHSGEQALALEKSFDVVSSYHLLAAHGETNIWIDFYAKFTPSNVIRYCATPDLSDAPKWVPCLFTVNDRARLVAYDGDGTGTWSTVSGVGVSTNYHRYTVKQDYVLKKWNLYFDGSNVLSGLGFRDDTISEFSRLSFGGRWDTATLIDEVSITATVPNGVSE